VILICSSYHLCFFCILYDFTLLRAYSVNKLQQIPITIHNVVAIGRRVSKNENLIEQKKINNRIRKQKNPTMLTQGVKFSVFRLTLLVIVTKVMPAATNAKPVIRGNFLWPTVLRPNPKPDPSVPVY